MMRDKKEHETKNTDKRILNLELKLLKKQSKQHKSVFLRLKDK